MSVPVNFAATLTARRTLAPDIFLNTFRVQDPSLFSSFTAGQVAVLQLPQGIRRAYSIASAPATLPEFDILYKLLPNGPGTNYLYNLPIGSAAQFKGPTGKFLVHDTAKPIVCIGAGTGIAPLRSIVFDRVAQQRDTTLLFGMRGTHPEFCVAEMQKLAEENPASFRFMATHTQAPEAATQGRVTDHIGTLPLDSDHVYFICGRPDMVADTVAALRIKGITSDQMFSEKY